MAGKHRLRKPSILARLRRLPAAVRARWTTTRHRPITVPEPCHELGATLVFAADLAALNAVPTPEPHGSGYYAVLAEEAVETEAHTRLMLATELPTDITQIDGWRLTGDLSTSLPGV